jgi:hypothetical protein
MPEQPTLIIQVPRGSAIERQLHAAPPPAIRGHEVVVQTAATDDEGNLEALAGEVVLSVLAPEELARHADEVQRIVRRAGTGTAPLVIVVEAAEELQDHQVAPVVEAAQHARRPVILRIIRPSER